MLFEIIHEAMLVSVIASLGSECTPPSVLFQAMFVVLSLCAVQRKLNTVMFNDAV